MSVRAAQPMRKSVRMNWTGPQKRRERVGVGVWQADRKTPCITRVNVITKRTADQVQALHPGALAWLEKNPTEFFVAIVGDGNLDRVVGFKFRDVVLGTPEAVAKLEAHA